MTEPVQTEFLKIYKLHAGFADRLTERREGSHRLFVSLLTGLLVVIAASLRFGTGGVSPNAVIVLCGVAGLLLCVAWFAVLRSYQILARGKLRALQELEHRLSYRFHEREQALLEERGYRRLSKVETALPLAFMLLFAGVIYVALL